MGHTSRRASVAHPQKNVLLIGDSRGDVTMADGCVRACVSVDNGMVVLCVYEWMMVVGM